MNLVRLVLLSSFLLLPSSFVYADGGTLRLRQCAGNYQVAVFTSPTPLRAGPVDVSLLVQDAETRAWLPQVQASLRLTSRTSGHVFEQQATPAAATNQLFHAALFNLPAPGWWDIEITISGLQGPADLRCALEAEVAAPRWQELWPWFGWPAFVIVLFVLSRRRAPRSRSLAASAKR